MTKRALHMASRPGLGQPKGLWVLAGTEFWERISFHGMQALLTLYLAGALLLPGRIEKIVGFTYYRSAVEAVTGPLSTQALAVQTFGLYGAFVYLTPLIGGWLGDRWITRRSAVVGGGLAMTAGHFALTFDTLLLPALLLLILGNGLYSGNLKAQVRALYADGDPRATYAFQYYYLAVNLGAFVAPLITGGLAAAYGWHYGFAFAGFGMLAGVIIYLLGQRHLPVDLPRREMGSVKTPLTRAERQRIIFLLAIWPLTVAFWVAQTQIWNVYNIWVRDTIDLQVGDFTVPVPWFSSLDGLSPIFWIPAVLILWKWQGRRGREPAALAKMGIGCLIFGASTMLLAYASTIAVDGARASLVYPIAFHLLSNLGWCFFTPVAVALFAEQSPPSWRGTMLGVNAAAGFAALLISGSMGSFYESAGSMIFWSANAAIVGGAGAILLILVPLSRRYLIADKPLADI